MRLLLPMILATLLTACAVKDEVPAAPPQPPLYPGETQEIRDLIIQYAAFHDIPEELLHRVIQRESDYRPDARNGPYWGMMQILPETAGQMGHSGPPSSLLDAETTLLYAGAIYAGRGWSPMGISTPLSCGTRVGTTTKPATAACWWKPACATGKCAATALPRRISASAFREPGTSSGKPV